MVQAERIERSIPQREPDLQSGAIPSRRRLHIWRKVDESNAYASSAIPWVSGPVANHLAAPSILAEAERLERSQPFGLAALAEPCCTIEPRFRKTWCGWPNSNRHPRRDKGLSFARLPLRHIRKLWCPKRDLNPHAFRHCVLSAARLPLRHSGLTKLGVPGRSPTG